MHVATRLVPTQRDGRRGKAGGGLAYANMPSIPNPCTWRQRATSRSGSAPGSRNGQMLPTKRGAMPSAYPRDLFGHVKEASSSLSRWERGPGAWPKRSFVSALGVSIVAPSCAGLSNAAQAHRQCLPEPVQTARRHASPCAGALRGLPRRAGSAERTAGAGWSLARGAGGLQRGRRHKAVRIFYPCTSNEMPSRRNKYGGNRVGPHEELLLAAHQSSKGASLKALMSVHDCAVATSSLRRETRLIWTHRLEW